MDVRNRFETPDMRAFREEVRTFVRANLPEDIRRKVAQERMDLPRDDQQRWHKILRAKGWACPGWPKAHGGPGFTDATGRLVCSGPSTRLGTAKPPTNAMA